MRRRNDGGDDGVVVSLLMGDELFENCGLGTEWRAGGMVRTQGPGTTLRRRNFPAGSCEIGYDLS
jgi:hypothetical protein